MRSGRILTYLRARLLAFSVPCLMVACIAAVAGSASGGEQPADGVGPSLGGAATENVQPSDSAEVSYCLTKIRALNIVAAG